MLEATPERIACARRMDDGGWSVPHGMPAFDGLDHAHQELIDVGMGVLVVGPAPLGLDYWALTEAGERWLAENEGNA